MKGKKKVIIGIIAAVVVVGIVVAVVLGMRRGKSDKTINVGNATESDEMSSWRTDGHRVAKAESGYYYLDWVILIRLQCLCILMTVHIRLFQCVPKLNVSIIHQIVMQY